MFKMDSIRGGSPYGAGVFAGDGSRQPTETELALAEHQGKYMAAVVKRLNVAWWSHTTILVYTLIPVHEIISLRFVIRLWNFTYCCQFLLLYVLSPPLSLFFLSVYSLKSCIWFEILLLDSSINNAKLSNVCSCLLYNVIKLHFIKNHRNQFWFMYLLSLIFGEL